MRVISFAAAAAALLASACGEAPPQQQHRQQIQVRGAEQEQLHKLDDLNRAIGLKRAIYASGFRCQRVTQSGFVQLHGNLDMWAARCDDTGDWAIFVGPDGSAQVRPCRDMAQVKLPLCRIGDSGPAKAS